MKKILTILYATVCVGSLSAQTFTITDSMQWKAYDDFNSALLDKTRNIYKADTEQKAADHRGNGARDNDRSGCAAAIWCQAIYYDMVINAYNRAKTEGNEDLMKKYKTLHDRIYGGEKSHYVNFNFDDPCALARAYQTFGKAEYLTNSEKSFCRVWYGSAKVGDDGSYADPARFSGKYGGGMFWEWQPIAKANPHKEGDFRSACINFPTVIAACLLHQLVPEGRAVPTAARPTRQTKEWYLEKAIEIYDWASKTLAPTNGRVADGIKILNFENGYEQGVYAAIFAQYLPMVVYDLGQKSYLTYIQRNMQKAWDNRDQTRGLQAGNFNKKTAETDVVESYGGSGMPALMLMFPAHISADDIQDGLEDIPSGAVGFNSDVYTIDGKLVMKDATLGQVGNLDKGLYIYQQKKMLVKK